MERLTDRDEFGNAYYKKCFEEPYVGTGCMIDGCNFQDEEACSALALYEDTGVTPDKLAIIGEEYSKMAKELAKYRGGENKQITIQGRTKLDEIIDKIEVLRDGAYKEWLDADDEGAFGEMNAYDRALEIVRGSQGVSEG